MQTDLAPRPDYEPPRQSRILSYGAPPSSDTVAMMQYGGQDVPEQPQNVPLQLLASNPIPVEVSARINPQVAPDISPVIMQNRQQSVQGTHRSFSNHNFLQHSELYRSTGVPESRHPSSIYTSVPNVSLPENVASPMTGNSVRGASRFAKFFEQKTTRDSASPVSFAGQSQMLQAPSSHGAHTDQQVLLNQYAASGGDNDAFQSMLAMLHNSSRASIRSHCTYRSLIAYIL